MRSLLIGLFLISGCGNEKSDESTKTRLNKVTVTLTPPPGAYDFGTYVRFDFPGRGDGAAHLETQQLDGSWRAEYGCRLDDGDSPPCVRIATSGTIVYRLIEGDVGSDARTAAYEIVPIARPMTTGDMVLAETETSCTAYGFKGEITASVDIQFAPVENSTDIPELSFTVPNVRKDGALEPRTAATPKTILTSILLNFRNPTNDETTMSYSLKEEEDRCDITVDGAFETTGKIAGTIHCASMTNSSNLTGPLGDSVEIEKSPWACDSIK